MTSTGKDEAIRGARVTITTPDFAQEYGTLTDEGGTFEFKDLPKGSYTVTAAKGGYVSLSYGQRGPGDIARPVELTGSQALAGVDVRLPRGGVISGRILDEFGEPLAEAMVQFSRLASQGSERRLVTVGRAIRTNDLGEFRAFGLPAGDYYVRASSIGAISSSGPAHTYYPGTGSLSSARRVRVGLDQQTDGLVFSVLPPRTARIRGIVLDPEGQPVNSAIVSVHQNLALGRGRRLAIRTVQAPAQPDGTFMVVGLEPGEYVLRARPAKAAAVTDLRSAISSVTVTDEDIEDVTLVMSRGGRAQGQIVTEDGKAPQSLKPAEVRVTAAPAQLGSPEIPRTVVVREDWSFEVAGVHDVRRILAAPPAGWALKSVMHDGQDVTDRPIDFAATRDVNDLQIVLTQKQSAVSGGVALDGKPVEDFVVVMFTDDKTRWGLQSLFVRTAVPEADGRFSIRGLLGGRYWAIALESMEPGEETDPDTLERLTILATSFSLQEGEVRTLDLTLTPY